MNPFSSRISGNSWVVPVTLMGAILIVLVGMAWINTNTFSSRSRFLSPDQVGRLEASFAGIPNEAKMLQAEVTKLREQLTTLQGAIGNKTREAQVINEQLQEIKLFAGLTEVAGPGLVITLRDATRSPNPGVAESDLVIHDEDVLKVVNELWNAGAEAVSVNNQRVSAGSNIRCVGSVIFVDAVRVAPPIAIRAIGDPQTLEGGLNMPLSVLDELRSVDPRMVEVRKADKLLLPAFAGSTQKKFAKVPPPKK